MHFRFIAFFAILFVQTGSVANASYRWDKPFQFTDADSGATGKTGLFPGDGAPVLYHQFVRECIESCNGSGAQHSYLQILADTDSGWAAAWANRALLTPVSRRSMDLRALFDGNGNAHVFFEFFDDSLSGSNADEVDIGYKRQDRASWAQDSVAVASENHLSVAVPCSLHADKTPKPFLDDTGILHLTWEFETPVVNDTCPSFWAAYAQKPLSDPDESWSPITFITDRISKREIQNCMTTPDTSLTDLAAQLEVDGNGIVHLFGKSSLKDVGNCQPDSSFQWWVYGTPPDSAGDPSFPEYPRWDGNTTATKLRSWEWEAALAQGATESEATDGSVQTASGTWIYDVFGSPSKAADRSCYIVRINTTTLVADSAEVIAPFGAPRVLQQTAEGHWHLVLSRRPVKDPAFPDDSREVYLSYTNDSDPYLAARNGTWTYPAPFTVSAPSGRGADDSRAGLISSSGDSVLVTFSSRADSNDTQGTGLGRSSQIYVARGRPLVSDSVATGTTEVWPAGGVVALDADFTIAPGGSLIIEPGVVVVAADSVDARNVGIDPGLIELIVQGTLIAEGTPAEPVRFRGTDTTATGTWYGIRFEDTSDNSISSLKYADFAAPEFAVTVDSLSGNLFGCTFTNTAAADVFVPRDTRVVEGATWRLDAPMSVVAANTDAGPASHGGQDPGRVEITVSGALRTEDLGSTGGLVEFRPVTPDNFSGKAWYGISVLGTGWSGDGRGVARIRDAKLDGAIFPLSFFQADTAEVSRSEVWHYGDTGITDWASDALIDSNVVVRDLGSMAEEQNRVGRVGIHSASSISTISNNEIFYNTDKGIWIDAGSKTGCTAAPVPPTRTILVTGNSVVEDAGIDLGTESGIHANWVCNEKNLIIADNQVHAWGDWGIGLQECSDVLVETNCIVGNVTGAIHRRQYLPIDALWNDVNKIFRNNFDENTSANVDVRAAPQVSPTDAGMRAGKVGLAEAGENRYEQQGAGTVNYQIGSPEVGRTDFAEVSEWFDVQGELLPDSSSIQLENATAVGSQSISIVDFVATLADTSTFVPKGAACTPPSAPSSSSRIAGGAGSRPSIDEPIAEIVRDLDVLRFPRSWSLGPIYPNPVSTRLRIEYAVPQNASGGLSVAVYDVRGRRVVNLVKDEAIPGFGTIEWGMRNRSGKRVAPGVYFIRLKSQSFNKTERVVVLR